MAIQVQIRRGSSAENDAFTGAAGEITVDTTNKVVRVHDGSTAGGFSLAGLTASGTITNKTINLTNNTLTGTLAQFNTALSDADFASLAGSETLTNKTINLTNNTLSGNLSQFNAALSDANFATLDGAETLTNKTLTAPIFTGTLTVSGDIVPGANLTYNLGSLTSFWSTIYGTANRALYADLAENYLGDQIYPPGTVLVFGGSHEVTISSVSHDTKVAGVVSTDPAYLMNAGQGNMSVALLGRVPCFVKGPVSRGTLLVTSDTPGVAEPLDGSRFQPGCIVGKALADITEPVVATIEVVVGKS
jgi:hypothetical protein